MVLRDNVVEESRETEIGVSLRDRDDLRRRLAALDARKEGLDLSPTSAQRLGSFTVAALILNRTIGTGIFSLPAQILALTGSSGVAITLWLVGGIIVMSLLLCWLELGMTVPLFNHVDEDGTQVVVSTPRSGGDKNFLEYIFHRPKFLATCVFGVIFIVFGHLAGNAIQFGISMATIVDPGCKEGQTCNRGAVVGWALGVVTLCALINISTRQLAIGLNNLFAVAKVLFVVAVSLIGIIYGTIHGDTCRRITWAKQTPDGGRFGDIVLALVFAIFPYSGFEQPFYVLAEVRNPRRTFPRAAICALGFALVFYPLANVGYLCMSPYTAADASNKDMVVAMFSKLAGKTDNEIDDASTRAVNAVLALFAFANIMAQTFTGSRVKQEIAKEGILPYSLMFATGSNTLVTKLWRPKHRGGGGGSVEEIDHHAEQVPMAATLLHLGCEVILILAIGLSLDPLDAYRLLTSLKVFTVVGILGVLTAGGLLHLKIDSWVRGSRGRHWYSIVKFLPWLDPLPVLIAVAGFALIVIGPFARPSVSLGEHIPYFTGLLAAWIVAVGSVGWWLWLKFDLRRSREYLHVERKPFIERDGENGELVLKAEILVVERLPARAKQAGSSA